MIDIEKLQQKVLDAIMEEMEESDYNDKMGPIEVEISIPTDMIEKKKKAKKPKDEEDE